MGMGMKYYLFQINMRTLCSHITQKRIRGVLEVVRSENKPNNPEEK